MDPGSSSDSPNTTKFNINEMVQMLIGPNKRISDRLIIPISIGNQLKTPEELRVEKIFESCTFKTVTSCAVGELFYENK